MIVAVDASGSMVPGYVYEIDRLLYVACKLVRASFTVVVFDTDIFFSSTYSPEQGLQVPNTMGGGTLVDSVIKMANGVEGLAGGLIIFTDGCVPAPRLKPVMKTLWVIAPGGAKLDKSYPGEVLYS